MKPLAKPNGGNGVTPERRKQLWSWAKTALMVGVFGVLLVALNRLLRAYTYEDIAAAVDQMSPAVIAAAIAVLVVQQSFYVLRERLCVGYAGCGDLATTRVAFASVVSRSLSTLGFSSVTGVGLRLHIYDRWGVDAGEVATISIFDNAVFLVGIAAQFGLVFTVLPIPHMLSSSIGDLAVRLIGIGALLLLMLYAAWSRRGRELQIWKLVIRAPNVRQVVAQILLPIIDLSLTAAIVTLCLPDGLGVTYFNIVTICLISSIASSITQVPAGIGVLEGTMLLFIDRPEAAASVVAGLFVYRLITNLLPIVVGAVLLVGLEFRARSAATAQPTLLAEATATLLAALTFVTGAIVMVVSASPAGSPLGELGQVLAIAAGSGMLFVARELQRHSRMAWRVALGALVLRAIVGFAIQPASRVIVVLIIVGGLLATSRRVFTAVPRPIPASPRWWIASGTVLAGTLWVAFVANGHHVTPSVYAEGGAMLGVAALATAAAVARVVRHRRAAQGASSVTSTS
ncbi:MAG: hypothetical protein ABI591_33795 [Kofleriaceae bacterium]